ncbi:MAG: insulinase family protein, partial [Gemmatimonadaceae bacterium]
MSRAALLTALVALASLANDLQAQATRAHRASAQRSAPKATGAPGTPIPLDPAIRTGKLPNGLRYVVRRNERPKDRVELRLVINAGSVLEDEDQRGLAHFTEHMLFNGTKRFKKNDIVSYLESIG